MSDLEFEDTATSESFNQTWLLSANDGRGAPSGISGKIHVADFEAYADTTSGVIPGGIALMEHATDAGFYTPFVAGADAVLDGYLANPEDAYTAKGNFKETLTIARLKSGTIFRSKLPVTAQRTTITYLTPSTGQFIYAD